MCLRVFSSANYSHSSLSIIFHLLKWIHMNRSLKKKKKKNNTWCVIDSYQRVWYLVFFLSLSLKGARKKGWNSSPENREFRGCVMQHHSMQTLNYHRCNGESRSRQKLFTFFSPTFRYTYVFPPPPRQSNKNCFVLAK